MSTSVASVVSHFPDVENGFTTTTAGSVSSGAATVTLNSAAGYTNGEPVVLVIDPTDSSKKQTFTGIIDTSGVQVTSVVWTAGTNQSHALGATVVDYATATHIAMISKGIKVSHNQDGTIKANAITAASQITDGIIGDAEMATAVKPVTLMNENSFDHVVSGCVWTADAAGSTRLASMTSGVVMLSGKRLTVAAVTSRTFTASKDVYDDLSDNGDGTAAHTYTDGTTNAASPALTAGSLRNAIVVVGAGSIAAAASINQGQEGRLLPIASSQPYEVTDSLGNLICPRDPQKRTLGYRQTVTTFNAGTNATTDVTACAMPIITDGLRKVELSAFGLIYQSGTVRQSLLHIREGGTDITTGQVWGTALQGTDTSPVRVLTPTAGLHTYKLSIECAAGANVSIDAPTNGAIFIKAKLI